MIDDFMKTVFFNELSEHEVCLVTFLKRGKYTPENDTGDFVVEQLLISEKNQKRLVQKIERRQNIDNSIIVYLIVNPINSVKAFVNFQASLLRDMADLNFHKFQKIDKHLFSSIQSALQRKNWVDVDIDHSYNQEALDIFENMKSEFASRKVSFVEVKTKTGAHLLLKHNDLHFDYPKLIKEFGQKMKAINKKFECELKPQSMVPLPGTIQYDHEVSFEFYDFSAKTDCENKCNSSSSIDIN